MGRFHMNKALSWAVWALAAANVCYAAWAWVDQGASSTKAAARPQVEVAALAPIAAPAAATAPASAPLDMWACLKLGPMKLKDGAEALSILGAGARAKAFPVQAPGYAEAIEVRFGPWAKKDAPELEKVLEPWRPAAMKPCEEKESEEWAKIK